MHLHENLGTAEALQYQAKVRSRLGRCVADSSRFCAVDPPSTAGKRTSQERSSDRSDIAPVKLMVTQDSLPMSRERKPLGPASIPQWNSPLASFASVSNSFREARRSADTLLNNAQTNVNTKLQDFDSRVRQAQQQATARFSSITVAGGLNRADWKNIRLAKLAPDGAGARPGQSLRKSQSAADFQRLAQRFKAENALDLVSCMPYMCACTQHMCASLLLQVCFRKHMQACAGAAVSWYSALGLAPCLVPSTALH